MAGRRLHHSQRQQSAGTAGTAGQHHGGQDPFFSALARLQEEYWAVCCDRRRLAEENRCLTQLLQSQRFISDGHGGTVEHRGGASLEAREKEAVDRGGDLENQSVNDLSVLDERSVHRDSAAVVDNATRGGVRETSPDLSTGQSDQSRRPSAVTSALRDVGACASVYPEWWDPKTTKRPTRTHGLPPTQQESQRAVESDPFMLSPVSRRRLLWDFVAGLFLLYESWASPVRLIFIPAHVEITTMETIELIILVFFSADIVLNFNTGAFQRGILTLRRREAVRQYVHGWFWIDLFATIPWDWFAFQNSGGMLSPLIRLLRAMKLLKTLRYFRFVRTTRALQRSESHFELVAVLKGLMVPLALIFALGFFVHVHCCIWAALWSGMPEVTSAREGIQLYFICFRDVYGCLLSGHELNTLTPEENVFDMVLAIYRLLIVIGLGAWTTFKSLLKYETTARTRIKTDHTLTYLRRHKIPAKTQIQVLWGLYEAGDAKEMQKDFVYLINSDLPKELQRRIMFELWSPKLMTIGLLDIVAQWDGTVIDDLAMLCFEEVMPSSSTLFNEGDPSYSAYLVLTGDLSVTSARVTTPIPDYKVGMWLGENALVNPAFRRGLTAVTNNLVCVMNVPAEGFRKLLQKKDLDGKFEEWCAAIVWRGLCGRCGTVGHHFADQCEGRAARQSRNGQEVSEYLKHHGLEELLPHLLKMGIMDLDGLRQLDLAAFYDQLRIVQPNLELEDIAIEALEPHLIEKYQADRRQSFQKMFSSAPDKLHLIFVSHSKLEAGTEAALLTNELTKLIKDNPGHSGNQMAVPVFLDTENLTSLADLRNIVSKSSNLALLLTNGVLTRPWVLVELVTAAQFGITVHLVEVVKPGMNFKYPDRAYFEKLSKGEIMDDSSMEVLSEHGIGLQDIERSIREIFKSISLPYSPHWPAEIRQAELQAILTRCEQGSEQGPRTRDRSSNTLQPLLSTSTWSSSSRLFRRLQFGVPPRASLQVNS